MIDSIAINADAFSRQLGALALRVDGAFEKVVRKTCFDLYARIVKRTPVKTGRAKASWGIGLQASSKVLPPGEYDTNVMVDAVTDDAYSFMHYSIKDDEVIIYNNVEYISHLEDGHSGQAPSGMVAISLAEFTHHFEMEAAKALAKL